MWSPAPPDAPADAPPDAPPDAPDTPLPLSHTPPAPDLTNDLTDDVHNDDNGCGGLQPTDLITRHPDRHVSQTPRTQSPRLKKAALVNPRTKRSHMSTQGQPALRTSPRLMTPAARRRSVLRRRRKRRRRRKKKKSSGRNDKEKNGQRPGLRESSSLPLPRRGRVAWNGQLHQHVDGPYMDKDSPQGLQGDSPHSSHHGEGLQGDSPHSSHHGEGLQGDSPPSHHGEGLQGDSPPSHHGEGLQGDSPPSHHGEGLQGDSPHSSHHGEGLQGDSPPSHHGEGLQGGSPHSSHHGEGLQGDSPPSHHGEGLQGDSPPSRHGEGLQGDSPHSSHHGEGLQGDSPHSSHHGEGFQQGEKQTHTVDSMEEAETSRDLMAAAGDRTVGGHEARPLPQPSGTAPGGDADLLQNQAKDEDKELFKDGRKISKSLTNSKRRNGLKASPTNAEMRKEMQKEEQNMSKRMHGGLTGYALPAQQTLPAHQTHRDQPETESSRRVQDAQGAWTENAKEGKRPLLKAAEKRKLWEKPLIKAAEKGKVGQKPLHKASVPDRPPPEAGADKTHRHTDRPSGHLQGFGNRQPPVKTTDTNQQPLTHRQSLDTKEGRKKLQRKTEPKKNNTTEHLMKLRAKKVDHPDLNSEMIKALTSVVNHYSNEFSKEEAILSQIIANTEQAEELLDSQRKTSPRKNSKKAKVGSGKMHEPIADPVISTERRGVGRPQPVILHRLVSAGHQNNDHQHMNTDHQHMNTDHQHMNTDHQHHISNQSHSGHITSVSNPLQALQHWLQDDVTKITNSNVQRIAVTKNLKEANATDDDSHSKVLSTTEKDNLKQQTKKEKDNLKQQLLPTQHDSSSSHPQVAFPADISHDLRQSVTATGTSHVGAQNPTHGTHSLPVHQSASLTEDSDTHRQVDTADSGGLSRDPAGIESDVRGQTFLNSDVPSTAENQPLARKLQHSVDGSPTPSQRPGLQAANGDTGNGRENQSVPTDDMTEQPQTVTSGDLTDERFVPGPDGVTQQQSQSVTDSDNKNASQLAVTNVLPDWHQQLMSSNGTASLLQPGSAGKAAPHQQQTSDNAEDTDTGTRLGVSRAISASVGPQSAGAGGSGVQDVTLTSVLTTTNQRQPAVSADHSEAVRAERPPPKESWTRAQWLFHSRSSSTDGENVGENNPKVTVKTHGQVAPGEDESVSGHPAVETQEATVRPRGTQSSAAAPTEGDQQTQPWKAEARPWGRQQVRRPLPPDLALSGHQHPHPHYAVLIHHGSPQPPRLVSHPQLVRGRHWGGTGFTAGRNGSRHPVVPLPPWPWGGKGFTAGRNGSRHPVVPLPFPTSLRKLPPSGRVPVTGQRNSSPVRTAPPGVRGAPDHAEGTTAADNATQTVTVAFFGSQLSE
ncbi:hypothetical protein ACOMHN_001904 [Nucella lapillus]